MYLDWFYDEFVINNIRDERFTIVKNFRSEVSKKKMFHCSTF